MAIYVSYLSSTWIQLYPKLRALMVIDILAIVLQTTKPRSGRAVRFIKKNKTADIGEKGDKDDTGTDTGYIRTVTAINVGVNPNPFLGATHVGSMLIPGVVATAQTKWSVRPDWALSIIDNNMELFLSDEDGVARFTTTDAKALRLKGIGGLKYQLFSDAKRYVINSSGYMTVGVDGVPLILQIDPPIQ